MLRHKYIKNYRKDPLYQHFYNALAPLVKDWQWTESPLPDTEQQARGDLQEFLRRSRLLMRKASRYDFEPLSCIMGGDYFLRRLLAVKRCLDAQQWGNACHELYDVIHFHHIQDQRILYTIIGLLEGYL